MGDIYASAISTTVLQYKEMPPRPVAYDGAVRMGELAPRIDVTAIRVSLCRFGEIVSCEIREGGALVCFQSRAAAAAAIDAGAGDMCGWLDFEYNERPYADRAPLAFARGLAGRADDG